MAQNYRNQQGSARSEEWRGGRQGRGEHYQTGADRDRFQSGDERRYSADWDDRSARGGYEGNRSYSAGGYPEEFGYRRDDERRDDERDEQQGNQRRGRESEEYGGSRFGESQRGVSREYQQRERDYGSRTGEYSQGSQSSFRGRGPKGYERSDERLKEMICERLTDDPRIDASEVNVEVTQKIVKLTGTVDDRRTKYEVEELIERCGGVKDIDNQLRVQSNRWRGSGESESGSSSLSSGSSSGRSTESRAGASTGSSSTGTSSTPSKRN